MKRNDFLNAVSQILDHVPSENQLDAFGQLLTEYGRSREESKRWEEIKEAVYSAIFPALVDYSRDSQKSLYEALNDCIVYLRMMKGEVYERELAKRDANGYDGAQRQTTTEEE